MDYNYNKFYTVDVWGNVFACDIGGPNPRLKDPVTALPRELTPRVIEQLYLVESSSALLLISQEGVQLRPTKEGIDKWIFSNLFPESEEPCLRASTSGFHISSYFTIPKTYFINYTIPFYNTPNISTFIFLFY